MEKKVENNARSNNAQGSTPSIIPLCVAARPCNRENPQGTFGTGISMGIFFGAVVSFWNLWLFLHLTETSFLT